MYRELCDQYFREGDKVIELVGFSRGAAQAVHFANLLHTQGLRHPGNRKHLLWSRSRDMGWSFRQPIANPNTDVRSPEILFLGLFDTVATFGFPLGPLRNKTSVWKVRTIPPNVTRAFHAMALDEVRRTFALIQPKMLKGDNGERDSRMYTVWFRGAHANIGGGYLDRGLSDIALSWMMEQLVWTWKTERGGRSPDHDTIHEALQMIKPGASEMSHWGGTTRERLSPNANGSIGRTRKLPRKPAWRSFEAQPHIHHAVSARQSDLIGDHYNLNRTLLRSIPGDALWSLDPPVFHDRTVEAIALDLAETLFTRVPIRPTEWLRSPLPNGGFFYRGGGDGKEWIAEGTSEGRGSPVADHQLSAMDFRLVASSWIRNKCDLEAVTKEIASSIDLSHLLEDDNDRWFDTESDAVKWVDGLLRIVWPLAPRGSRAEFLMIPIDRARRTAGLLPEAEHTYVGVTQAK